MLNTSPTPPADSSYERPYAATWDERTGTMYVHGTVDEISASAFRADLLSRVEVVDNGFVVDLSDVEFFPSAAVGALIAGLKAATAAEQRIQVRVADDTLPQRVLRICGLEYELS